METKDRKVVQDNKIQFSIHDYAYCAYSSEKVGVIESRFFIDDSSTNTFSFRKRNEIRLSSKSTYPAGYRPIKTSKIEDLKKLGNYIPSKYQFFYNTLLQWPTSVNGEMDNEE